MFKFRCVHCDKKIAVPTEFAGKHVRCPGCAQSTIVPFPSPEELAAAEEEGFRIHADPSAALASRTCKACGATMPPRGPCVACGHDPSDALRAAFDASLATVLTTPLPVAALEGPAAAGATGRTWVLVAAVVILVIALAAVVYFVLV
jgi:hypothetical protein